MKFVICGIALLLTGSTSFAADSTYFQSLKVRSMERITSSLYEYTKKTAIADAFEQCRNSHFKCTLVSEKTELHRENGQSDTVASSAVVKGE